MYPQLKRLFDILASLCAILILSPLLIPIVVILRFTAEGEIFYKQKRIGYKNQTFEILKFATMLKNSPNMLSGSLTVRNDPRVTNIGKFLRKTKINELPQILNVLSGDMSIVGPRPQMKVDFDIYPEHVKREIYDYVPGITGIGSIIFRDEEELLSQPNIEPRKFYVEDIAPYKGNLELWYKSHISFKNDCKLIFLTAWVIIFPNSKLVYSFFQDLPPNTIANLAAKTQNNAD